VRLKRVLKQEAQIVQVDLMASIDKKKVVFRAKLAEQAERYEEMKDFMKTVVQKSVPIKLNQEERNLLSVAYKNVVGARRASWRVLDSLSKRNLSDTDSDAEAKKKQSYAVQYKKKVENELTDICNDVLDLLNDFLLKNKDISAEEKVFYCKMKGDYHRYKAEYLFDITGCIQMASKAYEAALTESKELKSTNPIRLGLALNFSVFHYEIKKNKAQACSLAKSAFDNAVGELEDLTEEQYKDATLIMQLLRDNLTLWQSEGDAPDDDESAREMS